MDTNKEVDKLKSVNGELCAEINRQERVIERQQAEYAELVQINHRYAERVGLLESLVRDVWAAYDAKANDSFHPSWEVDGALRDRVAELGIEAD